MLKDKIISEIISRTGTPAYIYDGELLRSKAESLLRSFKGLNPHYSFKANPNIEILKTIRDSGFGAEVSSEFEARAALLAGFDPDDIMYDGPVKTDGEIRHALSSGISHFNVESRFEAERIADGLKNLESVITPTVCLRVNPREASSAGEVMTGESSRFGIDEEILAGEAESIKRAGLRINGIHLYVGSQILEKEKVSANFKKGLSILAELRAKNIIDKNTKPVYTFGPGIGVPYDKDEDGADYGAIAAPLIDSAAEFRSVHGGLTVKTEIGRLLTARAGIYAVKVIETKLSRGRLYVLVDGGIHHFMRYALTGAKHRARVIGKSGEGMKTAVIGGATCTPYDVLTETRIPEPAPGALIAVLDAGAYGWSMGMANFLSRATPPEIMAVDGRWKVIRGAGSFESLLNPGCTRP